MTKLFYILLWFVPRPRLVALGQGRASGLRVVFLGKHSGNNATPAVLVRDPANLNQHSNALGIVVRVVLGPLAFSHLYTRFKVPFLNGISGFYFSEDSRKHPLSFLVGQQLAGIEG